MFPVRIAALMVCLLLVACGSEPVVRHDWSGSSRVTFVDNGVETTQSHQVECHWTTGGFDWGTPSISHFVGEPHWLVRPDGSILVLESIHPCVFARDEGDPDVVIETHPEGKGRHGNDVIGTDHNAWLFDNVRRPTRVDRLSTAALVLNDGPVRITRIMGGAATLDAPSLLADAFPGLPAEPSGISSGIGRIVRPDDWLGAQASLWKLRQGETCDGRPIEGCADLVRYLRTNITPDFSRLDIDLGSADPAYRVTYHHPRVLLDRQLRQWDPEVCVAEDCRMPPQSTSKVISRDNSEMMFGGPETDEVVVVRFVTHTLSRWVFPGRYPHTGRGLNSR